MGEIYASLRNNATQFFAALRDRMKRMRRERRMEGEILFALHSFTPAPGHSEQLAFLEGDELTLKSDADQKWWHVKLNRTGRKGYVPMSYVARKSEAVHMEWYEVRLTREDANRILRNERYEPGSFIIRAHADNRHFTHSLALTVKTRDEDDTTIIHYEIYRAEGQFWIVGGKKFPTLTHFVQYYAGHHSGLRQPLTFSVKKNKLIDVWEIDSKDVIFDMEDEECLLGKGFFGEVYKGRLFGDVVAVKTMRPGKMSIDQFMQEAKIAREISHSHIVTVIGVCSAPARPLIVTEFLAGGNLKDFLRKTHVNTDECLLIAQKIACAMAHLEEKCFVHRDLAARNILVGETLSVIKLADFGLARCLEDSEYYKAVNKIFPVKWTAPEAFVIVGNSISDSQMGRCTTASDVWSFAVVLWELYSKGKEPYDGFTSNQIWRRVKEENYRLLCPTGCAPPIYKMMERCWLLEPSERPTFAELNTFLLNPYGEAQ